MARIARHPLASWAHTHRLGGHFLALARAHDVTVCAHSSGGRANRHDRVVWVQPVKSVATYAIAMHELGHVVGPDQRGHRHRLVKEAGAWRWALDHAETVNARFRARGRLSLLSYLAHAQGKHARGVSNAPRIPDAEAPFWSTLADLYEWPAGDVLDLECPWCRYALADGDRAWHLAEHGPATLVGPDGGDFWAARSARKAGVP